MCIHTAFCVHRGVPLNLAKRYQELEEELEEKSFFHMRRNLSNSCMEELLKSFQTLE